MLAASRSAQNYQSDGNAVPNCSNAAPGSAAGYPRKPMAGSLSERLAWLREIVADEPVPFAMHILDTEPDSALGSPKVTPQFRHYIEKVQSRNEDGRYCYPFRASLMALSRGVDRPRPFCARIIAEVVRSGYEWERVAARLKWPAEAFEVFLFGALGLFADAYTVR